MLLMKRTESKRVKILVCLLGSTGTLGRMHDFMVKTYRTNDVRFNSCQNEINSLSHTAPPLLSTTIVPRTRSEEWVWLYIHMGMNTVKCMVLLHR